MDPTIPGYTLADCDELRGDSLDKVVTWKGVATLPEGRPIRLRFVMTDARLYSFRAGDAVQVAAPAAELQVVQTFGADGNKPSGVYVQNDAAIDRDPADAAFGAGSVRFGDGPAELEYVVGNPRPPVKDVRGNGLELDDTFRLGNRFTLAAQVNSREKPVLQRLFSSYDPYPERSPEIQIPHDRQGWIGTRELILDFNPAGSRETGCLRLVVHGQSVTASGSFTAGEYHHLAATYDDGRVTLYLDGKQIGTGAVPGGPVSQLVNLRVGTDSGPFSDRFQGKAPNHQLRGYVDDVVALGRVLNADDIKMLSREGAATFIELRNSRN